MAHPSSLLWLTAADVTAAMPAVEERLRLAERTMVALARPGASELPPKIGIHPRPPGSFAHAMPAHLRGDGDAPTGAVAAGDLVGIKWIAGFETNRAADLPVLNALVVLNDPGTGVPVAILDGGPITAQRTAAVSGVALARWAPVVTGRPLEAALLGAGVQGHAHVPVLGHVLPGVRLRIHDVRAEAAESLAVVARATAGIGDASASASAREAVADADVVITAASFTTPDRRQTMTGDWLAPGATVVPVDYATMCAASVARDAALFLVDERGQFLANREAGQFDGYPDPMATIGEAILAGTPRPAGRVVATHLGVGLADLVFADAILRAAAARGLGTDLPR